MPGGVPLPGRTRAPRPLATGLQRAEVAELAPLRVKSTAVLGDDLLLIQEETVMDPPLAVGERVWIMSIGGSRDSWAVIARRV